MGLLIRPRQLPPVSLTSELGRRAARAALRSGQYTSVRRGALVPAVQADSRWEEDEARAIAAVASAARKLGNGSAFSHRSAALLHGLWVPRLAPTPEVTQRARPNSHGASSLKRYCADVPGDDVTTVNGVRVTTIERTIVDCARTLHPRGALAVVDSGLRALIGADRRCREADHALLAELRARLLEMVERGAPRGRRQARAVISAGDPYSESPKETELRWLVVSRGLPTPTTQLEVRTRGGTFYADLGWRWIARRTDGTQEVCLVLLEYDGEVKYLPDGGIVRSLEESSAAMVAEKRREDLIREIPGTSIHRFSKHDLRDPDGVLARVLAVVPAEIRNDLRPIPALLPH